VDEAQSLYDELFFDTSLEVGKTLSKGERDLKGLTHEKVVSFLFAAFLFTGTKKILPRIVFNLWRG
jgi:hypothetical protein